ncbi:signal transduction histidine kinase [Filimonas zeae]|uniref:histidine kinase n=1 Tax=Filimonas zeae TaxID=1737353 RepID=A0A917MYE1_9BACT|nr:ATP-binding protein [Filimonas zeae]MDR6342075.1 signal transduction histidine kinase [Filimonas zeae]GGH79206.1 histidine kinase [Filimonas zeae]
MYAVTADWLQSLDALQEVPAAQLQWLIDQSDVITLDTGSYLFRPGVPHTGTYIILEGSVQLYNLQHNEMNELAVFGPRSISGYLPFSRGKVAALYGVVQSPLTYLCFPVGRIQELISQHFELTQALVHVMTNRVRDYTSMIRQNEKMVALGKLSAGLAHELNNPAAAVLRGASALKQQMQLMPAGFEEIASLCLAPAEVDVVKKKLMEVLQQEDRPRLSLLQQSDREDELYQWLQQHGIKNSAALAENFTEYDFTTAKLEDLKAHIPDNYLSPIFNWLHKNLVTDKLVADIEEASRRIGQLVTSVKTFTHMDQGTAKQLTNLHSGIEDTLVILGYKLRHSNIQVVQELDAQLPLVPVQAGAINQVWTNLIDNAIDAMGTNGSGILRITTSHTGNQVQVAITDNGPGIPDDIAAKIFEPFFTTKAVGKGTGLGLDIAHNIVHQHKGRLQVQSQPGNTTFTVTLPLSNEPQTVTA